jgi:alpha-L-fucosidase 2
VQPFQPAGDLRLTLSREVRTGGYQRTLDLRDGVVEVEFKGGWGAGGEHRRELFVSAVHHVLAIRLVAGQPGTLALAAQLDRIPDPDCTLRRWTKGDRFGLEGRFTEGVAFAMACRIVPGNGALQDKGDGCLGLKGADEALLLLTIATNVEEKDPAAACARILDAAPADFAALHEAHVREHRSFFDRVSLDVGRSVEAEKLPLDERLKRIRSGGDDPGLIGLYFDFGRYLLLASSRNCRQPANAQGL